MQATHTYEKLRLLPLFQGMSHEDLTLMVGHTKLDFRKVAAKAVVATADTACEQLLFLLDGELQVEGTADNRRYVLTEQVHGPFAIQPEQLFGLHQRYTRTFTALTPCHLLAISKQEVLRLLEDHIIFRFNLLNITAAHAQRLDRRLWQVPPTTLPHRIVRFLEARCLRPAGKKLLKIKMNDLAADLGCSRMEVSQALHVLQDHELLTLSRNFIHIPHMELLIQNAVV